MIFIFIIIIIITFIIIAMAVVRSLVVEAFIASMIWISRFPLEKKTEFSKDSSVRVVNCSYNDDNSC